MLKKIVTLLCYHLSRAHFFLKSYGNRKNIYSILFRRTHLPLARKFIPVKELGLYLINPLLYLNARILKQNLIFSSASLHTLYL